MRWGGLGRGGARHGGEGWPESTGAASGGARPALLRLVALRYREGDEWRGKIELGPSIRSARLKRRQDSPA